MKISAAECQLIERGNCPDPFDFIKTLQEFKISFVDYESEDDGIYENEADTAVIFVPNEVDVWAFFKAAYALKPDGFLYEKVPNGVIVYLAWEGTEEDD